MKKDGITCLLGDSIYSISWTELQVSEQGVLFLLEVFHAHEKRNYSALVTPSDAHELLSNYPIPAAQFLNLVKESVAKGMVVDFVKIDGSYEGVRSKFLTCTTEEHNAICLSFSQPSSLEHLVNFTLILEIETKPLLHSALLDNVELKQKVLSLTTNLADSNQNCSQLQSEIEELQNKLQNTQQELHDYKFARKLADSETHLDSHPSLDWPIMEPIPQVVQDVAGVTFARDGQEDIKFTKDKRCVQKIGRDDWVTVKSTARLTSGIHRLKFRINSDDHKSGGLVVGLVDPLFSDMRKFIGEIGTNSVGIKKNNGGLSGSKYEVASGALFTYGSGDEITIVVNMNTRSAEFSCELSSFTINNLPTCVIPAVSLGYVGQSVEVW